MQIKELMQAVNCKKWPESWEVYFPIAEKEYEENGCIYAYPEYYEMLSVKYNVLKEFLPLFQESARKIQGDRDFELFLYFLCYVLNNSKNLKEELPQFSQPVSPKNCDDIKYDMLTGLAICSQLDTCYKNLIKRGLPEDIIEETMNVPFNGIRGFMQRHNGNYGYDLLNWFQLSIRGELFQFDKLQAQINSFFYCDVKVFQNEKGEKVALSVNQKIHPSGHIVGARFFEDEKDSFVSEFTETDEKYIGYPLNEKGLVENKKIVLDKKEWKLILEKGDPVIALHIPANASLEDEKVEKFLDFIKEFFKEYYPDYKYRAITIGSWLMDPQLSEILGENSKIVMFQKRFKKIQVASHGESVFKFVFKKPNLDFEIKDLPEDTSLQKKIKNMYLFNKAIYEAVGYII